VTSGGDTPDDIPRPAVRALLFVVWRLGMSTLLQIPLYFIRAT